MAAAAINNSICGAGVAYEATLSGVRYLCSGCGTAAAALTSYSQRINVSTNSWGPSFDLGFYASTPQSQFDAMEQLASAGVTTLFASGNENRDGATCTFQAHVASPFMLLVAAVNDKGTKSAYSNPCPSNFVSAPSSDSEYLANPRLGVCSATTGADRCTPGFGGTSAATPTVAGVVALMKQIRPSLRLRDVQGILARTSDRVDPSDSGWVQNAGGFWFNDKYGFGRVNARKAVVAAQSWPGMNMEGVTPTSESDFKAPQIAIPDNTGQSVTDTITFNITGRVVEHALLFVETDHTHPNDLEITLRSPSGTTSVLTQAFSTAPVYNLDGTSGVLRACTFSVCISRIPLISSHQSHSPNSILERRCPLFCSLKQHGNRLL